MKFIFIMASLLMFSSSAFGQQKEQGKGSGEGGEPEVIVVEDERWPGSGGAGGALSTPGSVIGSGPRGSNGGGVPNNSLYRFGCQECQSPSAFYTCQVGTPTTLGEDNLKIQLRLEKQNCCSARGGNVLNTKIGKCG